MKNDNAANPFIVGSPVPPDKFIERRAALDDFINYVGAVTPGNWSIVGWQNSGKTSLLKYVVARGKRLLPNGERYFFAYVDAASDNWTTNRELLETISEAILTATSGKLKCDKNVANMNAWSADLRLFRSQGNILVLCLDNFEQLFSLARERHFPANYLDGWRSLATEGITFITASRCPLTDIYEAGKLTSEFYNIFTTTNLGAWTDEEVDAFYAAYWPNTVPNFADRALIAELTGNHPFYTQMAANIAVRIRRKHKLLHGDITDKLRERFAKEARDKMFGLYRNCDNRPLRDTVRHHAEMTGFYADNAAVEKLKNYGILIDTSPALRLFSPVFAEGVKSPEWERRWEKLMAIQERNEHVEAEGNTTTAPEESPSTPLLGILASGALLFAIVAAVYLVTAQGFFSVATVTIVVLLALIVYDLTVRGKLTKETIDFLGNLIPPMWRGGKENK